MIMILKGHKNLNKVLCMPDEFSNETVENLK